MPLFDYRCPACDRVFELLVRADTVPACPTCGGTALEKQLSRPAAPGKSAGMLRSARAQAAREGHFSHYAAHEKPKT